MGLSFWCFPVINGLCPNLTVGFFLGSIKRPHGRNGPGRASQNRWSSERQTSPGCCTFLAFPKNWEPPERSRRRSGGGGGQGCAGGGFLRPRNIESKGEKGGRRVSGVGVSGQTVQVCIAGLLCKADPAGLPAGGGRRSGASRAMSDKSDLSDFARCP